MSSDIRSALHGLFPAPAVPFDDNLAIAEDEFTAHLKTMSAVEGVSGFAVNGHAGEVGTLTRAERLRVVQLAREAAGPGQVIISGIDCVEPGQAVAELHKLAGGGADAALVLPPFDSMFRRGLARNRDAVYHWFDALGVAGVPLVVFQYPLSTGCFYPTAVLRDVVTLEHVVAVKNAVWNTEFYIEQLAAVLRRSIRRAQARDKVMRNVAALVDTPEGRKDGRPSRAMTLDQATTVLEHATYDPLHAYVVLSLMTGLRTEEACALCWSHVVAWVPEAKEWRPVTETGFRRKKYAVYVLRSFRRIT